MSLPITGSFFTGRLKLGNHHYTSTFYGIEINRLKTVINNSMHNWTLLPRSILVKNEIKLVHAKGIKV